MVFQACPDFKGIKTSSPVTMLVALKRFKLALISKGLRHNFSDRHDISLSFKLALISKGLRQQRVDVVDVDQQVSSLP